MHRPFYFPVPEFALRIAFGEATSALTEGQLVDPGRLQELGFEFKFPEIEPALQDTFENR
jgi:NAD dependent epimerase/dehydratase family enzyme